MFEDVFVIPDSQIGYLIEKAALPGSWSHSPLSLLQSPSSSSPFRKAQMMDYPEDTAQIFHNSPGLPGPDWWRGEAGAESRIKQGEILNNIIFLKGRASSRSSKPPNCHIAPGSEHQRKNSRYHYPCWPWTSASAFQPGIVLPVRGVHPLQNFHCHHHCHLHRLHHSHCHCWHRLLLVLQKKKLHMRKRRVFSSPSFRKALTQQWSSRLMPGIRGMASSLS